MIPAPNVPAASRSGQVSPRLRRRHIGCADQMRYPCILPYLGSSLKWAMRSEATLKIESQRAPKNISTTPSMLRSCSLERGPFTEWTVRCTLAQEFMLRRTPLRRMPTPASIPRRRTGRKEITAIQAAPQESPQIHTDRDGRSPELRPFVRRQTRRSE